MAAIAIIDHHDDLENVGVLSHPEIDALFLSGTIPPGINIQIPFISGSNVFTENNTFNQDIIVDGDIHVYGNLVNHGEVAEIEVATLSVESTVIFIGYGATASSIQGDRGIVFNLQGSDDPSFFWDYSGSEFRLATLDTTLISTGSAEVNIFSEPTAEDYQTLHLGDLLSEGSIFTSGSMTALSASITSGTIGSITSDVIFVPNLTASYITSSNISTDNAIVTGSLVVNNVFCADGVSPFLVSGPGISVDKDPSTGQFSVSALMVGRQKHMGAIDENIDAGDVVEIPGLDMSSVIFDDQRWDVYVNGVLQIYGVEADFIIDPSSGLVFNFDLETDDIISVLILN